MNDVPVVIAGAGPVGMTLAYDLARRGVRCLIVERKDSTTRHPKMDITNARSMELFRSAGLADQLRAAGVSEDLGFDVSWVTTLTGRELHRFHYLNPKVWREKIREKNDGTQPREPAMRASQVEIEPVLRAAIDAHPLVDVRFQTAFEGCSQDEEGVEVTLRDMVSQQVTRVRCDFLVGCDGANSVVRAALGINLSGEGKLQSRFMTHFTSDELDVLQKGGPAWHHFSKLGTLISQDDGHVWTLHTTLPRGTETNPDPSAEIARFAGRPIRHKVILANSWTPHLLVADQYRKGRVFLAGDAVHQYIPMGGYGMNTGVGDAFDLGWKLAAVVQGFGGGALLDSYEAERRPVGLRNCAAAKMNVEERMKIMGSFTPEVFESGAAAEEASRSLGDTIAGIGNKENERWGVEYGYSYQGSPVVSREDEQVPQSFEGYTPNTIAGSRLPHFFLRSGDAVFDHLGKWMTLVALGDAHTRGFEDAARKLGIPLEILRIDPREEAIARVYEKPLILVRPDQHVAWRGLAANEEQALSALGASVGRRT